MNNNPKILSEEGEITNSISNPVYEGSCNSFDSVGIFNSINLFLLKLNENTIDTNFKLLKPLTLLFHNPLYANIVSFSQGVELSFKKRNLGKKNGGNDNENNAFNTYSTAKPKF